MQETTCDISKTPLPFYNIDRYCPTCKNTIKLLGINRSKQLHVGKKKATVQERETTTTESNHEGSESIDNRNVYSKATE
jgi:uncharacterized Zn finger protein (UPF0148 family)